MLLIGELKLSKTYMLKPKEVNRKWYVIDAKSQHLGRVAVAAADILRGKNKVCYTPHVDCGDFVIVVNCSDVVLTGNKLSQKYYRRHTGYIGHLKETRCDKMLKEKPTSVVCSAIKGMIPKTTLGRGILSRLKLYAGAEHLHEAQKPVSVSV